MGIFKNARVLLFLVLFALSLLSSAQADRIYLKNGNILEGSIIEEKPQSILLEYSLESGSGYTEIRRSQIKSVEKESLADIKREKAAVSAERSRPQGLAGKPQKEILQREYKKIVTGILFLPAAFLFVSLFSLVIVSKIIKAGFERPLGIKLGCLYMNAASLFFVFLGLALSRSAPKREVFIASLILVSVVSFTVIFGLFYLRQWARSVSVVLLGVCLLAGAGFLARKDLAQASSERLNEVIIETGQKSPQIYRLVKGVNVSLEPRIIFIFVSFFLLSLLYLFRPKTIQAFANAKQFKVAIATRKDRPKQELAFEAARAGKEIKVRRFLLRGFREHEALGYSFYLPAGMEKTHTPTPEATTALFLEKKRNLIFSIARMEDVEYKKIVDSLIRHPDPYVAMSKTLTTPYYLAKTVFIREVKFDGKEGVMQAGTKEEINLCRFILKIGSHDYIECAFVNKKDDFSFDAAKILNIIAAIRQK